MFPDATDLNTLALDFAPDAGLVSVVRRFATEFCQRALGDGEACARLALVTHELLENTVKYASDGRTRLGITLRKHDGAPPEITIVTTNRGSQEDVDALTSIIDTLRDARNPMESYQTFMRKAARRQNGSGLGLARIEAEADMTIEYRRQVDEVSVIARSAPRTERQ